MANITNQNNNQTRLGYAEGTYAHPISKPLYFVGDLFMGSARYIFGPISEERHRAELAALSQRVKAKEDKSGLPSIVDTLLDATIDGAINIIKIDEPENPRNSPRNRAA